MEIHVAFYGEDGFSRLDAIRLAYENDEPDESEPGDPAIDQDASTAEVNERKQAQADNWFAHLEGRTSLFGDFYPFELTDNVLRRRPLTDGRRLYLFLLICSRLALVEQASGNRQRLAALFERLCAVSLQRMLPTMTVRIFGANSDDRRTHFGVSLRAAFETLAADLCEQTMQAGLDALPRGTGERGIDIVAHYPWNDGLNSAFAVFAQCAAQSEEWPGKGLEAYGPRHQGIINFRHAPANILFIPVHFRTPEGSWVNPADPWLTVLIDRVRLLNLLGVDLPADILGDPTFRNLLQIAA